MRKGSGDTLSVNAVFMAIGAIRIAAGALWIMSVKSIVPIKIIIRGTTGDIPPDKSSSSSTTVSAAQVVSSACPKGIIAASKMITDQFTFS